MSDNKIPAEGGAMFHPDRHKKNQIIAPIKEGEEIPIPKMSDELAAMSDVAALEYGKLCDRFIGDRAYDSSHIVEAHECGQTWMYRKMQEELASERVMRESFERVAAKVIKEADEHLATIESLRLERDAYRQALMGIGENLSSVPISIAKEALAKYPNPPIQ